MANEPTTRKRVKSFLTTKDNPYDPCDQFVNWFVFDVTNGYNSCGLLARIAKVSDQLTMSENEAEINEAIDWIIEHDLTQNYKKFTKEY